MPPVPPPADLQALQAILGDAVIALCTHSDETTDPSDDPARPAPRHRRGHDCVTCCSPASLAAVVPLAEPLPLPSGAGVAERTVLVRAGPTLSIYAARQRSPPAS